MEAGALVEEVVEGEKEDDDVVRIPEAVAEVVVELPTGKGAGGRLVVVAGGATGVYEGVVEVVEDVEGGEGIGVVLVVLDVLDELDVLEVDDAATGVLAMPEEPTQGKVTM